MQTFFFFDFTFWKLNKLYNFKYIGIARLQGMFGYHPYNGLSFS